LKKNLMTVSPVNLSRLPRGAEFAFVLFFRGAYAMVFDQQLVDVIARPLQLTQSLHKSILVTVC
jgi:hypothetical protein